MDRPTYNEHCLKVATINSKRLAGQNHIYDKMHPDYGERIELVISEALK